MQYAPTMSLPANAPNGVTAGLDWANADHMACVVHAAGKVIGRFTVEHTDAGLKTLTSRLAEAEAGEAAIERGGGPVVQTLLEARVTVVVISPNQVKNLRSRFGSAGNKDDRFDAWPTPCAPTGPGCVRSCPTAQPRPRCEPPSAAAAIWSLTGSHCATSCART